LMLRLMTRNSLSWARRSVVLHTPWSDLSPDMLLNRNGNGRGKLRSSSGPVNGDEVSAHRTGADGGNGSVSPARYGTNHNGGGQDKGSHDPNQTTSINLANQEKSKQTEPDDAIGEKESMPWVVVRSSGRDGGYREEGTRGPGPGNDGGRSK